MPAQIEDDGERIRSLVARLTSNSIDELEELGSDLTSAVRELQEFLKSEGERVQREIVNYAHLTETTLAAIKNIIETTFRPASRATRPRIDFEPSALAPFASGGFRILIARLGEPPGFDFRVHPHMLRHAGATSWRMTTSARARCRPISGIDIFSTPCATPNWLPTRLKISSVINLVGLSVPHSPTPLRARSFRRRRGLLGRRLCRDAAP